MNKLAEAQNYKLPAKTETEYLLEAARADAGFDKMMKFKKGDYFLDSEEIPKGTEYIAHCVGFTKTWVKFKDGGVAERRVYRVASGERVAERDELDEQDQTKWPPGLDGRPNDPWVFQYLLPLENPTSGEVCIFVTNSYGGKRAIGDLISAYGRRCAKNSRSAGQPLVRLQKVMMPTRNFGDVPRPYFEIVNWMDHISKEPIREFSPESLKHDMNDDIPF